MSMPMRASPTIGKMVSCNRQLKEIFLHILNQKNKIKPIIIKKKEIPIEVDRERESENKFGSILHRKCQ